MTIADVSAAFNRHAAAALLGAKGYVDVRGWADPVLVFVVVLRNGVQFEDGSSTNVLKQACTYAQGIKNLTGEYP